MKQLKPFSRLAGLTVGAALLGHTIRVQAATANVLVGSGGLVFVPASTNINAGDQVTWTWSGNFHSSTSGSGGTPNGLWDSGVANQPHSFSHTFGSAGTFPYYCSIHVGEGMIGSIVVSASAQPPQVTLSSPSSGAVFAAPADVTLQASVVNGTGSVTNVQFLVDATVVANVTNAPFTAVAHGLAAGNHILAAVAQDNNSLKATNAVNISVVAPVPIVLGAPVWTSANTFQLNYSAAVGLRYFLQRATDPGAGVWVSLVTNTAAQAQETFTDTNAPAEGGFYRVGQVPNP